MSRVRPDRICEHDFMCPFGSVSLGSTVPGHLALQLSELSGELRLRRVGQLVVQRTRQLLLHRLFVENLQKKKSELMLQ